MVVTDTGHVFISLSLRIVPRYFGVSVPKGGALTFALQGDVDIARV